MARHGANRPYKEKELFNSSVESLCRLHVQEMLSYRLASRVFTMIQHTSGQGRNYKGEEDTMKIGP